MKNKNFSLIVKFFLTLFVVFLPVLASAQPFNDPVNQGLGAVQREAFPTQTGTGVLGANTVVGVIGVVIKLILFVSGALAVLFVVIGGITYLTAGGNTEQAEKAKKTITNALIGIIIIILSYVIVNVIVNLVNCGFNRGVGGFFGGC